MNAARALLPGVIRATPWRPVAAGAGTALAFVVTMTLVPVTLDVNGVTRVLRLAALLGAVGLAFLLDDPSECTTAVTPVSRRLRILLRPLIVAPAAGLWWGALTLVLRADVDREVWMAVPLTGITVEAAVLALIGVAVAALGVRRVPHDGGGALAAPTLIALAVLGQVLPKRLMMFPAPDSAHWEQQHRVWVCLLPLAFGLLIWAARDLRSTRLASSLWHRQKITYHRTRDTDPSVGVDAGDFHCGAAANE